MIEFVTSIVLYKIYPMLSIKVNNYICFNFSINILCLHYEKWVNLCETAVVLTIEDG